MMIFLVAPRGNVGAVEGEEFKSAISEKNRDSGKWSVHSEKWKKSCPTLRTRKREQKVEIDVALPKMETGCRRTRKRKLNLDGALKKWKNDFRRT